MNKYNLIYKIATSCISKLLLLTLVFALPLFTMAQEKQAVPLHEIVTGKVVDEHNEPLPGAIVKVREGTIDEATQTNVDGEFSLKVRDKKNAIIDVTYMGFLPSEATITGNSLFIKMTEKPLALDEVVVIAYGSVSKKDLTGVVAEVDVDAIKKAPVISFAEALAGRVAGVSVSAMDGQPGADMNIVIRGANSITQNNSPLYIVDGFPIEDLQAASINPEDIKTFNILKDASSTALYGARGANGVIVIETKGGLEGKPIINFSSMFGVASVRKKMDMMNPYEFVKYQLELFPSSAESSYLGGERTLDYYKTEKGIKWQDEIYRNTFIHNYNLAIRGGSAETKYSVSGSAFFQPGVILSTGSDRYQLRSTLDQKLNKKMSLTLNINGSFVNNYGQIVASGDGGTTSSYLLYRTWAFRPVAGRSDINLMEELTDPENISNADIRLNPVLTSKNDYTRNQNKSLVSNLGYRYNIMRGLQFKMVGTLRYNQEKRKIFNNSKTTSGSPLNPTNVLGVNGQIRYSDAFTWNGEATLSWDKTYNRVHRVGAMGGTSIQERQFEQYGYTGYQLDEYEQLGMSGLDDGLMRNPIAMKMAFRLASFFGRFNYGYKSKYLATATVRADGSSKFPNHMWGFFPSGALAWNVSEENFVKDIDFISSAKLRATYGVTGNNRVGDFDAYAALRVPIDASYSFGKAEPGRGLVPSAMGNSDLKWETTYQLDLGLDLSLFEDRLSLNLDVYSKDTKDLLLLADAPRTTGYASIMKNAGRVKNKGLEVTVNTLNIKNKDFEWSSSFNIAFNKNKVVKLENDTENMFTTVGFFSSYKASPLYLARVGQSMGLFYGYVFDGVYQYDDFDNTAPGVYVLKPHITSNASEADRASIQPGDIKYRDLNGDGIVDDNDMTIIGNGNPKHVGGLTNNLKYKDFDLSFLLQWSYGNDIYNANRLLFDGNAMQGKDINQYASYNKRWTPYNPSNKYYRSGGEGPAGRHSSRVIEDGSYLRLKTVTVGYNIPKKVLKSWGISELRVSVSAQNLLTFTGYSGMDPEVSTRGNSPLTPSFDYSAYPIARTIVFGVQSTF